MKTSRIVLCLLLTVTISLLVGCGSSSPRETIAATSGSGQSAQVGAAFASPLVVTVMKGSSPVSGVTVTFTAPASGASGTFAGGVNTATTNSSGVATSAVFTANTTAGAYTVTAAATGVSGSASFSLTNTAGAASQIAATSGSGQSTQVGTAFANPLVATVKDQYNNPISGATVTFTAPASGASGTFRTSGTNTEQDTTNSSGVATSSTFTANATWGPAYTVTATVSGVATPADFTLTNNPPPPVIVATSGSGQNGQVGAAFSAPLVATVTYGAGGPPVAGATVTFTAPASGASGTFASSGTNTEQDTTNASGVATSSTFTADTKVGAYTVTATTAGAANPASFGLTNTPGPPASITATSGSGQSTQINTAFPNPLVATVLDAYSNPVPNATVTFTAPASGASGTFAKSGTITEQETTNASGVATSSTFTANGTAGGPYTVTGSVSGVATPANFSLTNTPPAPVIVATSGSGQSAQVGTAFAAPLVATVTQGVGGPPLAGVSVTFTAPASGASGTFASTGTNTEVDTTNASGVATSSTFTANTKAGGYNVSATTPGAANPANFGLTNTAGSASQIAATSGSGQSAAVNTAFANPLVATVTDQYNNPVSGATVTFTAPSSGASGTFATTGTNTEQDTTNQSGMATSSTFTANATAGGPYTVAASVAGVATPANFSLTNTAACTGTNNQLLNGNYAFMANGWDGSTTMTSGVGSFVADGNGHITSGEIDVADQQSGTGPQTGTFTGTYCMASDNLATVALTFNSGINGTAAFAIAMDASDGNGHIISYDANNPTLLVAGLVRKQTTSAFKNSSLSGNYAFGFVGADSSFTQSTFNRFAVAGVLSMDGNGNICNGSFQCEYDFDDGAGGQNSVGTGTINASTYNVTSSTTGRGTATINSTNPPSTTSSLIFYVVNSSELLMMEADATAPVMIEAGQVLKQTSTTLNGTSVIELEGYDVNAAAPDVQAGVLTTQNGNFSVQIDENDGGTLSQNSPSGTYSIAANGRVTLPSGGGNHPPVFYMIAQNQAFAVGTDNGVLFGTMNAQSATSFTDTSLSGMYLGGTEPLADDNGSVSVSSVDFNNSNDTLSGTNDKENNQGPQTGSISGDYCTASFPTYSACSGSSNGRVLVCGSIANNTCSSLQVILYMISDSQFVAMEAQTGSGSNPKLTDFHQ